MSRHKVIWNDAGREPQCAPDPEYPNGKDLDMTPFLQDGWPTCKVDLPYPAKRCGVYMVECECGLTVAVTTAGRPDDPRSVTVGCKKQRSEDLH